MTLPSTQKFANPVESTEIFSSQLERYTERVSAALNTSYLVSGEAQPIKSSYVINQPVERPVYRQTFSITITSATQSTTLNLQSTNVVFLSIAGTVQQSTTTFPFGFNNNTDWITGSISSNVLTTSCTASFVGAQVLLTLEYAYIA
jgi:hypothetical protein